MLRLLRLSVLVLLPVFAAAQDIPSASPAVLPNDSAGAIVSPPLVNAVVSDSGRTAMAKADSAQKPVAAPAPTASVAPAAAVPVVSRPVSKRTSTAAILPFTGSLPASDLAALTNRFESEMIAVDSYQILERRRADQILKEQGFQQSGACGSSGCQVEMGQLLGVQKLLLGDVSQVGNVLTLTVRRVDVATGASEFSHALDLRGNAEDMLRLGCREMALIASGAKKSDGDRSVLAPEKKTALWPWIVGGAVVAGGAVTAAILLTQDKSSNTSSNTSSSSETSVWVAW